MSNDSFPFIFKIKYEKEYFESYKLLYVAIDNYVLKIMDVLGYTDLIPFGNKSFYIGNKKPVDVQIISARKRVKKVLPSVKFLWNKFLIKKRSILDNTLETSWGLENIPICLDLKDNELIDIIINVPWIIGEFKELQAGPYTQQGMKELLGLRNRL